MKSLKNFKKNITEWGSLLFYHLMYKFKYSKQFKKTVVVKRKGLFLVLGFALFPGIAVVGIFYALYIYFEWVWTYFDRGIKLKEGHSLKVLSFKQRLILKRHLSR